MKLFKPIISVLSFISFAFVSYLLVNKFVFNDGLIITSNNSPNAFNISISSSEGDLSKLKSRKTRRNSPFAMLLLGVDGNDFEETRSDTIILALVDPKNKEIGLLSIYRDLLIELPDSGQRNKLNAAYRFGGPVMITEVIENLFEIPIEHHLVINFNGFVDLIDSIGGIEIDVDKAMGHKKIRLDRGLQKLSGKEALTYVRFRSDGEGDFGRTRRQRTVLKALMDQTLKLRNITKVNEIYQTLKENTDTDMTKTRIVELALKFSNANGRNIKTFNLEATPTSISGVSYVNVTEEELERVKTELKIFLE